ncbi:hypothetical protein QUF80_06455 [Desulfococcaceae bacterium HSG8]|nr:hypothetical protein [Desulfococcaceae bacterium HSG8]
MKRELHVSRFTFHTYKIENMFGKYHELDGKYPENYGKKVKLCHLDCHNNRYGE